MGILTVVEVAVARVAAYEITQLNGGRLYLDFTRKRQGEMAQKIVWNSVADPWHFGVEPGPDPWIHASD